MSQPDDGFYRGDPPVRSTQQPPPGYAPPAYGPPPGWGPPPMYVVRRPTNSTAVLALVFGFVFPPVGLGLGISARRQIRRTREEGDGLALAGIVVGSIGTAVYTMLLLIWLWAVLTVVSFGP